jgi:hypothetical protein
MPIIRKKNIKKQGGKKPLVNYDLIVKNVLNWIRDNNIQPTSRDVKNFILENDLQVGNWITLKKRLLSGGNGWDMSLVGFKSKAKFVLSLDKNKKTQPEKTKVEEKVEEIESEESSEVENIEKPDVKPKKKSGNINTQTALVNLLKNVDGTGNFNVSITLTFKA